MTNIVYSTTRQWNPGDEFILLGVRYLITKYIGEHNSIIYNRNPQTRINLEYVNEKGIKRNFINKIYALYKRNSLFWDNSIKPNSNLNWVDIIVFAGSPEWRGERLEELYSYALKYNLPTIFLGLGSVGKLNYTSFGTNEKKVLEKTKLITTRDPVCNEGLSHLNSHYLPCPALFSSPFYKTVKQVKKIGLLYGSNHAITNNNISTESYTYICDIYKKLLNKYKNIYDFEFIAHYIDELPLFYKDFNGEKIMYSYDSKEYLDIYSKYDLIIGHRVHGIGMCASMGIPGIMFSHDLRSLTVKGFLAEVIEINSSDESFFNLFEKTINDIEIKSNNLIKHRTETEEKYKKLLENLK